MKTKKLLKISFVLLFLLNIISCKKHKFYRNDDGFATKVDFSAAFVVNGEGNSLSILNLNTNSLVEEFQFKGGTFPHHIYMNSDKSLFAVAFTNLDLSGGHAGAHGSGKYFVQVFNTVTGEHETNIFLKSLPHNAIFSPDGNELWIGQANDDKSFVYIYDTKKWKLRNEIEVGAGLGETTFSSDGTKAYASNTGSGTVSVIDVSSKTVVETVSVGTDPVGAWSASNGKMYVDNETSQTVTEIDVASNAINSTISLGFKPGYVAYNSILNELWVSDATNGRVAYFSKSAGIWTLQNTISTGADAHAIAFSANNSLAYVTNQGANTVSIINTSTHTFLQTISVGEKPNGIALK